MEQFIQRHRGCIVGTLEGFDRVVFRGTLRSLSFVDGLGRFLSMRGILLKDLGVWTQNCTRRLVEHAQAVARGSNRPYQYLSSSSVRKEELATEIAQRDGITEGLICVLACVEPCMSFDVYRNRNTKRLELVARQRKCRFFYFYVMSREFGLMHVRLASWIPFEVQVCMNGRSYLQRQLDREGIGYQKRDNCFTRIDDLPRAQQIMDGLTHRNWEQALNRMIRPLNVLLRRGGPLADHHGYYWTIRQSEYATDVMFQDSASLAKVYRALCRHAIEALGSQDVLRFLGFQARGLFKQEVTSDLKRRIEGVRLKHCVGLNSIKMYDKQGSVLRIETTINDPKRFRVLRKAQDDPQSKLKWRPMCKGVSQIARRVEVCAAANGRYLDALSVVGEPAPCHEVLDPVCKPVRHEGRSHRPLRPIAPDDAAMFEAVLRGEHLIHGFTNGDLQRVLHPTPPPDEHRRRRRANKIGHRLRLLRRHGLIQKVGRTRRYRITIKGHNTMTLALSLRAANRNMLRAA